MSGIIESSLKAFDFMALGPVVEGAGGAIADWDGRPLTPHSDGKVIAAASRELLDEVLAVVQEQQRSLVV